MPQLTLSEELNQIREKGLKEKWTQKQINNAILAHILEYRKDNTLSISELEKLVKDNAQLTEKMLARLQRINSLSGAQ